MGDGIRRWNRATGRAEAPASRTRRISAWPEGGQTADLIGAGGEMSLHRQQGVELGGLDFVHTGMECEPHCAYALILPSSS